MRFQALHLTRFGCFSDQSVQFGSAPKKPDFHIIYGDNEAGKSTLRDAISAFLYGIPARTEYNFLHDYKALQIGADLDTRNGLLSAIRVKANRDSLSTPDGAILAEDTLTRELLGLSQSDFVNLFSLDLHALLEGGSDILQAKGDLGALLFAGASGISSVSQTVDQARESANLFFKPRSSSSQLAQQLRRLKDIDTELKSLDVQAPHFHRMKLESADAKRAYDAAAGALKENRAAYEKQRNTLQTLAPWREFQDLQEQLKAYIDVPSADEDSLVRAGALQIELNTLESAKSDLDEELKSAQEKLEWLKPPPYQDRLITGLDALQVDELEARASTARLDLPGRRSELEDINRLINVTLVRLGLEPNSDPEPHLISKTDAAKTAALADTGQTRAAEREHARSELENAEADLALAKQAIADLPEPQDLAPLDDAITTYRRDLDNDRLLEMETELEASQHRLDRVLSTLAPWTGAPEDLDALALSSLSDLETLQKKKDGLSADLSGLQSEHKSLSKTIESDAAQLGELEADPDIVTDQAATDLLKERDKLWGDHVQSIEQGAIDDLMASADAFETSMRAYDLAYSKRLAHASELGQIKTRRVNQKSAQAERKIVETSLAETNAGLVEFRDEVARFADTLGLPGSTSIAEIKTWLAARERALEEWATRQDRANALEKRRSRFSTAISNLKTTLESVEGKYAGSDDTLLAACERTFAKRRTEAEEYKVARGKYDTLVRQQRQRAEAAKSVQAAYHAWQQEWTDALAQASLEHDLPVAIKARLEDLADLSAQLHERRKLARRIALMEASEAAFSKAVTELADATGLGDKSADALEQSATLKAKAQTLDKQAVQAAALKEQIEKYQADLRSMTGKHVDMNDEAETLCKSVKADDLAACIDILKSAGSAQALANQTRTLRRQISGLLASDDEAVWSAALSPLIESQDALVAAEAEQKNAEFQIDMEETRARELYAEWKATEQALSEIGDDASAATLQQERATLLEDIDRGARRFISLKAGAMVVDEAVRLFRDQHRGAMLKQASDVFSTMTRGRYPRLVTMTADEREILVAERNDKITLSADKLSKGTRAQLYLALRIAGHAEYAKSQTPLPFIADDILEEFDNHRAKETLLLMTKMAEAGQVIYLTHHQHLVDMAQNIAVNRCTVHRLTPTTPIPAENAN